MSKSSPLALLVALVVCTTSGAQEVRQYTLEGGLNLISFDVFPVDPNPGAIFSDVVSQGRLISVSRFSASLNSWQFFAPGTPPFLIELVECVPGDGYVIALTPGPPVVVDVVGQPAELGALGPLDRSLVSGWSLVGFLTDKSRSWTGVLGDDRLECRGLVSFDAGYRGFELPDPAFGPAGGVIGPLYDSGEEYGSPALRQIEPRRGYWVRMNSAVVLGPQLALWMESDLNRDSPAFPGDATDEDLNGDLDFDYGYTVWTGSGYAVDDEGVTVRATQDTIVFRVPAGAVSPTIPVLSRTLTVANRGDRGLVPPVSYSGNDVLRGRIELLGDLSDWLTIDGAAGPVDFVVPGPESPQLFSLRADMNGLPVAPQEGVLRVQSNAGTQDVTVRFLVPPVVGVYRGEVNMWLGTEPDEATSAVKSRKQIRLVISDADANGVPDSAVLLQSGTPSFEEDHPLSVSVVNSEETELALSSVAPLVVPVGPGNPFETEYSRTVSISVCRQVPDYVETKGRLIPLVGLYQESVSGAGIQDVTWTGRFSLTQVREDQ